MKDLDWIVTLLVDLHSFCEQNGLVVLSNRLADAIEEAAPMIRGGETQSARNVEPFGRRPRHFPAKGQTRRPTGFSGISLAYDAATGTKL